MAISKRSQEYWDKWRAIPRWKPPPLKDTAGLGIVTCNREDFLKKVLDSIVKTVFVVIIFILVVIEVLVLLKTGHLQNCLKKVILKNCRIGRVINKVWIICL